MAQREGIVYQSSIQPYGNGSVFMMNGDTEDWIIAPLDAPFSGDTIRIADAKYRKAPLTAENAAVLRTLFPFCAPQRVLTREKSIGLGDRLGIAGSGHCAVLEQYPDVYPVLAQQSMRELDLTGRTYTDVLDAATFAVFRAGFTRGFGADGDHLKKADDIANALALGFTMITLDVSEQIDNTANSLSDDALLAASYDRELAALYVGREVSLGAAQFTFTLDEFIRSSLIYGKALDYAEDIYHTLFASKDEADLEFSIDETTFPTTVLQHWFVASELTRRGVRFATIAPRFCGEFQKGIDYIGDLDQFEREIAGHVAVADAFGYKLSIHSGSDKFSVFPLIEKYTRGKFHVKTAGTNWLCAMRVIAEREPALYRAAHAFALSSFDAACRYYHVTTDLSKIPSLDTLPDKALPALFDNDDARQLIHITYGFLLQARDENGAFRFRDALYAAWRKHADAYSALLVSHIGRHLALLTGQNTSR